MPSFIRPARVDVTEDGGGLAFIAAVVAVCAVVAAVVSFVLGHLALILGGLAVVGGGTLTAVLFLRRYMRPAGARTALPATDRTPALPPAPLRALQRPVRALPSPQQVHLHFHGVTAEDAAEIARRELR